MKNPSAKFDLTNSIVEKVVADNLKPPSLRQLMRWKRVTRRCDSLDAVKLRDRLRLMRFRREKREDAGPA